MPDGNVVIDRKGIQRNMRSEVLKDGATENPVESGRPQPWLLSGPLVGVIMENVQKLADSVRGGASLDVVCGLGFQLVDRMIKKLKSDSILNYHNASFLFRLMEVIRKTLQRIAKGMTQQSPSD